MEQNTKSDEAGLTHIDDEEMEALSEIYHILMQAKQRPFTTKSDIARIAANAVGLCASEGLISTRLNEDTWTNKWMITTAGLEWMEDLGDVLSPRH